MTRPYRGCATLTLAVALLSLSCNNRPGTARQYELEGQILALRPEAGEVLIKHGDIKGFMPAMTMPYKVHDAALLHGKAAGDLVKATLHVAPDEAWLATLEKTGTAPLEYKSDFPAAAFISPLKPGDAVPDTALRDETGQPFSLQDWRGSAVAVTFIYVRCPLPQFCPMLDRRFSEVQAGIRSTPALAGRARLLSVSFDPDADTPEQLRAHAAKLGADPAIWKFATAPRETVDRFAAAFGVNVIREQDRTITHNMRTAVAAPDGRVVAIHEGSDWSATQVVDEMRQALAR
jgi:protein SCO1/2